MKKYAVITGASSGIGRAFCDVFAQNGYDLLLVSRDKNELSKAANEIETKYGVSTDFLALDLTENDASEKLWKHIGSKKVAVFVNNAGFGDQAKVVDADWKKLESMITLNITALTELSQRAAQHMKKNGSGHILNLASIAAFLPGPGMAVYYATKSYVLSFSEALAQELSGSGVEVTTLCPGPTSTHFADTASAKDSKLFQGNLPSAEDVARYGYESMTRSKVVAVHKLKNKFIAHVVPRLLPRFLVRKLVDKAQN